MSRVLLLILPTIIPTPTHEFSFNSYNTAAIAKADPKLGIEEGQTRQHARLLYLLGIEQLIVGVNKMDATTPPWSEDRFEEIKDEFHKMLQTIGFKPKKVPFIPYSGYDGDNLDTKTDKAPWYKGWKANINPKTAVTGFTLLECLNDFIQPPKRLPDAPLRMPVSDIYHIKVSRRDSPEQIFAHRKRTTLSNTADHCMILQGCWHNYCRSN